MTDDGICRVLVFLKEFLGAGECNLVDIFFDVIGIHADSMIGNGECAGFFVDGHFHIHLAELTLEFSERGEGFKFLGSVDGVGNELAQKNLMVAVKEFFDNGENVFGCNPDFTCCHFYLMFLGLQVFMKLTASSFKIIKKRAITRYDTLI